MSGLPDSNGSNGNGHPTTDSEYHRGVTDHSAPDVPYNGKIEDQERKSEDEDDTDDEFKQFGVKRIEAISSVWTTTSLVIAYVTMYFLTNATALESNVTIFARTYATSSFAAASLLSTIGVVQGVVLSVIKPPFSKLADVWGRSEAFVLAVLLLTLGYILQAASRDINTFAAAQVFYSAGSTGLQLLIQIFIADTSNLLNRAIFSSIPDLPYLWTTWAGPPIDGALIDPITGVGWPWAYGMWAIIVPVCFLPLAGSLLYNQHKAHNMGVMPPSPFRGMTVWPAFTTKWRAKFQKNHNSKEVEAMPTSDVEPLTLWQGLTKVWLEIDGTGLLLFSASLSLILLPLTLYKTAVGGFSNPSMIAMIVIGCILLPIFILWESSPKLAPYAFFPRDLFKKRSVLAGVGIGFFYFLAFYLSIQPYFYQYLLVVRNMSTTTGGYVLNVFSFSSSVASFVIGFFIKYTGHYKYFITFGACVYLLGLGVMFKYRQADTSNASIIGTQIAIGIGGGLLNVPAQLGVQAACNSHQEVASATAVFLTLVEVGGAVGNGISGSIWPETVLPRLNALLPPETRDMASIFLNDVTTATSYPVGSPTREAVSLAYQHGMDTLMIVALCMCVPILLLSFLMENYKLAEMNQKVKGRVVGGVESGGRESVVNRSWKFWKR